MSVFPKITYVYDRRKIASAKKKSAVEIRITYNNKQKYISTGILLHPKQWKNGVVVGLADAQQLNQQLEKLVIDIRKILSDMADIGDIDIFAVSERLKEKKQESITLIDFINERMKIRQHGKAKATKKRYRHFLRSFLKWGGIRSFKDIMEANLIAYDEYLIKQRLNNNSKWNNYHRFLNSFILDAIKIGLIKNNPYESLKLNRGDDSKGISKCLTDKEFEKLKEAEMPTKSLEQVRDIFIFQTYTCLSYTDLISFNPKNIRIVNGVKVYTGNRGKTDKRFVVPMLQGAIEILRKYNNRLPIISNVKYNAYLKIVAQYAGIDKPLTTHWARHTGATLLLNAGVSMQVVSKICGHSSIKTTEKVYAKLFDSTVVEEIKKLSMTPKPI